MSDDPYLDPPPNYAKLLVAFVRGMSEDGWRRLVADLSDVQLIDWVNALDEINSQAFRQHLWEPMKKTREEQP